MTPFEIPITPATPQRFTITLGVVIYTLTFQWCAPAAAWLLTIGTQDGTTIAGGLLLVTGADLLEQLAYLGIQGQLVVQTDHDIDAVPTFTSLGDAGHLYYLSP